MLTMFQLVEYRCISGRKYANHFSDVIITAECDENNAWTEPDWADYTCSVGKYDERVCVCLGHDDFPPTALLISAVGGAMESKFNAAFRMQVKYVIFRL